MYTIDTIFHRNCRPDCGAGARDQKCGICLEAKEAEQRTIVHEPGCLQSFHIECFEAWSRSCRDRKVDVTCPACRGFLVEVCPDTGVTWESRLISDGDDPEWETDPEISESEGESVGISSLGSTEFGLGLDHGSGPEFSEDDGSGTDAELSESNGESVVISGSGSTDYGSGSQVDSESNSGSGSNSGSESNSGSNPNNDSGPSPNDGSEMGITPDPIPHEPSHDDEDELWWQDI